MKIILNAILVQYMQIIHLKSEQNLLTERACMLVLMVLI